MMNSGHKKPLEFPDFQEKSSSQAVVVSIYLSQFVPKLSPNRIARRGR